jgi:hypothetical protein
MSDIMAGLDLETLDEMTQRERDDHIVALWHHRGNLYDMYAPALMLDYGAEFTKQHWRAVRYADQGGTSTKPLAEVVLFSCQNILSYTVAGWEHGIRNEFLQLRKTGISKEKVMELVLFTQLYAGMRGLGHVYHAVGDFLPAWAPPEEPVDSFPDGWAPDPAAFKSGLDFSRREFTSQDRANLTQWYEANVGYLPDSIAFAMKYHPEFLKVNRGKWEVAIRTMPKQMAPYLMIRHNVETGSVEGIRESASLARTWGVSRKHVLQAVTGTVMYFTGPEGWYPVREALGEMLEAWTE